MVRLLQISQKNSVRKLMQEIRVDPYGIKIMLPKALGLLMRINSVSNITANILKQEMLSLGADAAVSRGALTGKTKRTDCLIMGNLAQFQGLCRKLQKQPFGLNRLADEISLSLSHYQQDTFKLDLGGFTLGLGKSTRLMAIVNLTPDSFSGDGLYKDTRSQGHKVTRSQGHKDTRSIVDRVQKLVEEGADIIDLGGESTRPGAKNVSVKEELSRVIPVVRLLAKKIRVPLSVDTYKPEVAKAALDHGAVLVNDISGLRDPLMAKVVSRYKAGVVIMHMKGTPRTMQKDPRYVSLVDEIISFLGQAIRQAEEAGVKRDKIVVDPGIGFGKTVEQNLKILNSLEEFKSLGRPILVGPSRKSFIGKILKLNEGERLYGTLSACVLASLKGASILRVHDVKEVKQAIRVCDAIRNFN
jgi:dihydropteroate synthase